MKKCVLLASGGMDSTTLAYWLKKKEYDVYPLFVDYGQICAKTELDTLKELLPNTVVQNLEIITINNLYKKSDSCFIYKRNLWETHTTADDLILPFRNLLLLTVGLSYANTLGIKEVFSAFINSNHAKEIDCTADYFNNIDVFIKQNSSQIIQMPFRFKTKYEVAQIGIELAVPIGRTFSCQASDIIPCGACPNCVDRIDALKKISEEIING